MSKIEVEADCGEHIDEAITRVLEMAIESQCTHVLVFNGTKLTINPNSCFDGIRGVWSAHCASLVTVPPSEVVKPDPVLPETPPTTLTGIVREAVAALDRTGPEGVESAVCRLRATGIQPGVHVGTLTEDSPAKDVLEWYAGQILSVIDQKAWYAVNSIINCCDKFAPEGGP